MHITSISATTTATAYTSFYRATLFLLHCYRGRRSTMYLVLRGFYTLVVGEKRCHEAKETLRSNHLSIQRKKDLGFLSFGETGGWCCCLRNCFCVMAVKLVFLNLWHARAAFRGGDGGGSNTILRFSFLPIIVLFCIHRGGGQRVGNQGNGMNGSLKLDGAGVCVCILSSFVSFLLPHCSSSSACYYTTRAGS